MSGTNAECYTHLRDDGSPILTLAGAFDFTSVARAREEFKQLIHEGHDRIIVDLADLDYIDSSGLGVLIGALARIRERNGELALIVTSSKIRRVFEVTKLTYIFRIYPGISSIPRKPPT